ncbi:MAG: protease DO family protein, partial [Thermomicrobium sp.]
MRRSMIGAVAVVAFLAGWIAGSGCLRTPIAASPTQSTHSVATATPTASTAPITLGFTPPSSPSVSLPAPALGSDFATA